MKPQRFTFLPRSGSYRQSGAYDGRADPATRTLQVEIDLNNGDRKLEPGMYADVSLNVQRTGSVLTLPVQAVDRSGGGPSALVVDNTGTH